MNYTVGQIVSALAIIAGVIASLSAILAVIGKFWKWISKKEYSPILEEINKMEIRIMGKMIENDTEINRKIDKLTQDVNNLDISECKDVIVSYISSIEDGALLTHHLKNVLMKLWKDILMFYIKILISIRDGQKL